MVWLQPTMTSECLKEWMDNESSQQFHINTEYFSQVGIWSVIIKTHLLEGRSLPFHIDIDIMLSYSYASES